MLSSRFFNPRIAVLAFVGAIFIVCFALNLVVPSDDSFRSLVRFHWGRTSNLFQTPLNEQRWIFHGAEYPFNFQNDVGMVIKTGYGTQKRVLAQMEAMGLEGTRNAIIVVGDFNKTLSDNEREVQIEDVIGPMLEDPALAESTESPRALVYGALQEELRLGNEEKAKEIAKSSGWDMDALKFIPGLELAYRRAPHRKWWIVMDDDTYIVQSSLVKVLSHLNSDEDQYIGNAIGNYASRFAHGGSAIIISKRTLEHLMERPDVRLEAKKRSLSEAWGDRLVATTLMKMGIFLDERFSPFFNGEPPRITKITPDNFCLPVASFHGMGEPDQMRAVGNIMHEREASKVVFRGSLWAMYHETDVMYFGQHPVQPGGHDHVGELTTGVTTYENCASAMDCVSHCDKPWSSCLAWTWEEHTLKCHTAPWVIVGGPQAGKKSGLHYNKASDIGARCQEMISNNKWANYKDP